MTALVHDWRWRTDLRGFEIPIEGFITLANVSVLPLYVVVCGGIAVGKSHVVRKHGLADHYRVMDVDDYMTRNGYTNYDRAGYQFRRCMDEIAADIDAVKRARLSMISMGTGGNYEFLRFRLEEARLHHYQTAILYVGVTGMDQALFQNDERAANGERHVKAHELHHIRQSAKDAAESVGRILREDRDLVGYYCVHRNVR